MSQIDAQDPLEQALAKIHQQYEEGLKLIEKLEQDQNNINYDEATLASWEAMSYNKIHKYWGTQYYNKKVNSLKAQEQADKAQLHTDEKALEKLDPALISICNSINSLNNAVEDATNDEHCNANLIAEDIQNTAKVLQNLFKAIGQELLGDLYTNAIQSNGGLSDADMEKLAVLSMGQMNKVGNELQGIQNSLLALVEDYHKTYDNAEADQEDFKSKLSQILFGAHNDQVEYDEAVKANAKAMMNGLLNVMDLVGTEIASIMPGFTEAMTTMNEIIKKIEAILNDTKLSIPEKRKEVMALVMFLVSFFEVIKSQVESSKLKNKQEMSQADIHVSAMKITDTKMWEKIKEEVEANEAAAKITMVICEVIVGAIMTLAAPGAGMAAMMAAFTTLSVLQTEGDIHLSTGASIGLAIAEAALMMGAGAGDAIGGKVADDIASNVVEDLNTTIVNAAKEAAQAVGKEADEEAIQNGEEVLRNVAKEAAKKAAQKASAQFDKQSFSTLLRMVLKGTYKKALQEAIENAAKEAAKRAIEDSTLLAENAITNAASITKDDVNVVATRAANEAVAKASGKSLDSVSQSPWTKARGLAALTYGFTSTGLFADLLKKASSNQGYLDFIEVLQGLLQMLALMYGSGMGNGATFKEALETGDLSKIGNAISLIPQAVQATASLSTYESLKVEGKAVQGLSMTGSVEDVLHMFIQQLQQVSNQEREIFIKEIEQDQSSTEALAQHVNDGERAGIEILVSAAG